MSTTSPCKYFVIHNPSAGKEKHELFNRVLNGLRAAKCDIHVEQTRAPGDGIKLASCAGEFDRVIAAGGDGTVNETINGLMQIKDAPPLAIIPVGTSNVLAAEIGLPRTATALADLIRFGTPSAISLGYVNGRYFSVMAGAGFDAHMVANTNMRLKKRFGAAAYAASFFQQFKNFDFPDYHLTVDGAAKIVGSVIISNVQRYAPHWIIAPGAAITDPKLHVCHVSRSCRRSNRMIPLRLFGGKFARDRGLNIDIASSITITGPVGDPVQADGDIVTSLPATITVVPDAVQLLLPKQT
ncbi:MAG: diacylglycerol kinase (ATP) [Gammaproteobacteria bacterium]|jgi:diacylglycerol kinase (ATP)